jgi:hypothetical protein
MIAAVSLIRPNYYSYINNFLFPCLGIRSLESQSTPTFQATVTSFTLPIVRNKTLQSPLCNRHTYSLTVTDQSSCRIWRHSIKLHLFPPLSFLSFLIFSFFPSPIFLRLFSFFLFLHRSSTLHVIVCSIPYLFFLRFLISISSISSFSYFPCFFHSFVSLLFNFFFNFSSLYFTFFPTFFFVHFLSYPLLQSN